MHLFGDGGGRRQERGVNTTISQKVGCAAKMPTIEATKQATTSQRNKRTRGRCNNDDAVERHVCSKVVQ
jgi:hypothetical protein